MVLVDRAGVEVEDLATMPTSPRAPAIGLPTFADSIRASSSRCSSTSVASRRNSRARSAGETARHARERGPRATAASVSSRPACSSASVSSVAGFARSASWRYSTAPHPPIGAVRARLGDERGEEPAVLAGLRMPEDADGEAPLRSSTASGVPSSARAVTRSPSPSCAEALMVVRLHRQRAPAEQRARGAIRLDLDLVVGEDARRVLVPLVADDLRQVLDEVAAEATFSTCEPRQIASTGRSRSSAPRGAPARRRRDGAAAGRLGMRAPGRRAQDRDRRRRRRSARRARRASPATPSPSRAGRAAHGRPRARRRARSRAARARSRAPRPRSARGRRTS